MAAAARGDLLDGAGIDYLIAAAGDSPKLMPLVIYTATGGIEFVIQAWLLARRRHQSTPVLSASLESTCARPRGHWYQARR